MTNLFSTVKERILYILEFKGITKSSFFEKIGMTYGNFTGNNKKKPINSDAITNILSEFPDINPMWLLTGKGDIFQTITTKDFEIEVDIQILRYIQQLKYLSQKIVEINTILNDHLKAANNEINDFAAKLLLKDISKSGKLYSDLKQWEKFDLDKKRELHDKLEDYFEVIHKLFFDSFETLCKEIQGLNIQSLSNPKG